MSGNPIIRTHNTASYTIYANLKIDKKTDYPPLWQSLLNRNDLAIGKLAEIDFEII